MDLLLSPQMGRALSPSCRNHAGKRCTLCFLLLLLAVACACQSKAVHKVLVAYPEHWDDGDRKSCFLGPPGGATVRIPNGQPNLPELDCDRIVDGENLHSTPSDRILVRDVELSGASFSNQLESGATQVINETPVNCQRKGEGMSCTP